MDIRLTEKISPEEALLLLNANMTGEMQATAAYYPESKLTSLRWLEYEMAINTLGATEELAASCADALCADELVIMKKTKSGETLVDIKPMVKSFAVSFDGKIRVKCVLSADSSAFLNPEYIIKLLREECGILSSENLMSESYTILRTNAYNDDLSEFC
jgi:hypothetical protein